MIRLILTSAIVITSVIAAYGCEDVQHEILLRNGDLSWAHACQGAKRVFLGIAVASVATMFL